MEPFQVVILLALLFLAFLAVVLRVEYGQSKPCQPKADDISKRYKEITGRPKVQWWGSDKTWDDAERELVKEAAVKAKARQDEIKFLLFVVGVLFFITCLTYTFVEFHLLDEVNKLANDVYSSARRVYRSARRAYRRTSSEEIGAYVFLLASWLIALVVVCTKMLSTTKIIPKSTEINTYKSTASYIPRHTPTYTPSPSTALTKKEKEELASAVGAVVGAVFLIGIAVVAGVAIGSLAKRSDDPLGIKKELDG